MAIEEVCSSTRQPWIFVLPGYEPDVCFSVFGKPVHAHSIILSMHSAFLREFVDLSSPPEEEEQEHKGRKFRFEYIVMMDEDQNWGFEKVRVLK